MTRKRILLIYFGFLLALLATTALVLQESGMSQSFVESILSRFLNKDRYSLGNASIDLGDGSVTLENLQLSTGNQGDNQASVEVETVKVAVDTNPLGQIGSVQEIALVGLQLELDVSGGQLPNFSALLSSSGIELPESDGRSPAVLLRDSSIALRLSPSSEPVRFTEVNLQFLPDRSDSQNMILAGTMKAPLGLEVRVSGSANLAAPEFRVLLEIEGIPLHADIASPYSSAVVEYLEQAGIQGEIKKLSAWLEYPSSHQGKISQTLVTGANLEISNLSCTLPNLPYPLLGAQARIAANSRDQGTVNFLLENKSIHGDLKAEGTITQCFTSQRLIEAKVKTVDLLISPTLETALRAIPIVSIVWDATQPTAGRVDAELRLWNRKAGGRLETSLDLDLKGVEATYRGFPSPSGQRFGFPSPISNIKGSVHVRPGMVTLEKIEGNLQGALVQVDGSIDIKGPSIPSDSPRSFDLDIRGKDLTFAPALRESLVEAYPQAAEIYDQYSPSGHADLQVRIGSATDPASPPKVRVILHLQGATASYQGFPLSFEQLHGKIDISEQGVAFDVQGNRGSAELSLHGQFLPPQTGVGSETSPRSELWLECTNLELGTELRTAVSNVSDDARNIWQQIDPHGKVDCQLSLWRGSEDPGFSYDIRVDLNRVSAQPELAHNPITDLQGPIFVHGDGSGHRIDLSAIEGQIYNGPDSEPARLVLQGVIEGSDAAQKITLNAVVRDLELTDQFAEFLDGSDALSMEAWRVLQPSGHVDIVTELEWLPATNEMDAKLRIQLKNIASDADFLPGQASQLNGEILVDNGRASFQDVRGLIGDSPVHCTNGSISREQNASIVEVLVTAEDFPIDAKLANLMSGPLRTTYLDRNMRGSAKVRRLQMKLTFPDDGPMATELSGNILIRELGMDLGTRLENLSGSWTIDHALISDQGGSVEGTLESSTVTVLGHRLGGLSGEFTANADRVVFRELQGRIHNGRLIGNSENGQDLIFELAGAGDLSLNLRWEQINLAALLRTLGFETEDYRGNLSGEITLEEMPGYEILEAKAGGTVQISEGQLGIVPLFTAIYRYLSPRRRPRFDEAKLSFGLGDQRITVQELELRSPVLTVTGRGHLRLDGYLDLALDFPDFFGKAGEWLVIPQFIKFLGGRVVQFQVFGYLRSPEARPRWLWQPQIAEVPIAPIPAYRPKNLTR